MINRLIFRFILFFCFRIFLWLLFSFFCFRFYFFSLGFSFFCFLFSLCLFNSFRFSFWFFFILPFLAFCFCFIFLVKIFEFFFHVSKNTSEFISMTKKAIKKVFMEKIIKFTHESFLIKSFSKLIFLFKFISFSLLFCSLFFILFISLGMNIFEKISFGVLSFLFFLCSIFSILFISSRLIFNNIVLSSWTTKVRIVKWLFNEELTSRPIMEIF